MVAEQQAALVVEDLHKSFAALEVLKGVSLAAEEGGVLSIIGASGSGKSTLLRCINLLEVPDSGRVWVGGELIVMRQRRDGTAEPGDPRQVDRLRTRLGMVFQSFNLWSHMTVLENVVEAPVHVLKVAKAEAEKRALALLDKVGISDKRNHYPAHLSGGQQQRAAIARALAMEPDVMLFDEATSALDPELVGEVLKVIHDLADEGRTMILVTHEMGFAREVSSEVIFLHQGRVEEQGPPAQVFGQPRSERCRQFLAAHIS
ncbi:MAG: histidine/lysine/arginine/ornithine ABC transporter ATP-binding protein [Rhodospirillaceae bacterium]|nr:histidine/lysine/arginine/ornithine ABC transporter ATP-binding protein [Rhodospirillaceae bacterium]